MSRISSLSTPTVYAIFSASKKGIMPILFNTHLAYIKGLAAAVRGKADLYAAPSVTAFFPPPFKRSPQGRPRGKRRRGGQPGYPGRTRTLLPVDAVDEVVGLKPEECIQCHMPWSGDNPKPWHHQVIELPPLPSVVTEYQWHQLTCAACGDVARVSWPTGVPSGAYGPRVQATVALYTGAHRLSKRTTQQMMNDVFGVPR